MNKPVRDEIMTPKGRFSPQNTRGFRDALGQFATGVTVVTTMTDEGPVGMTANSFSSVSLDPAIVLWSVGKKATRYGLFVDAPRFAINVLSSEQAKLARAFAKDGRAFDETNSEMIDGLPLVRHALASFECDLHDTCDGGDHTIILGRVTNVTLGAGAPLVFHHGSFGSFLGN